MVHNFYYRLIVTIFATLITFGVIAISDHPTYRIVFVALVMSVIGLALWELYALGKAKGYSPLSVVGLATSFVYLMLIALDLDLWPYVALGGGFFVAYICTLQKSQRALTTLSITTFGVVYVVIPLAFWIDISLLPAGRFWLFYLIAVTKASDIGGYVAGKLLGRHPFAPLISPKKTWEGSVGGLLASAIMSWCFKESIVLGIVLGALAQLGDLAESLLKRDAGVKDSNKLPGIGGMLDMVDSLIFTTPFLYIVILL